MAGADPITLALPNLVTILTGINGGAVPGGGGVTYTHTVVTVELQGRIWDQVDDSLRPYIGAEALGDDLEWMPSSQMFGIVDLPLICHLPMSIDPAARILAQRALFIDIKNAIATDPTLRAGGAATGVIHCQPVSSHYDGSDPLSVHTSRINLRIKYRAPGRQG